MCVAVDHVHELAVLPPKDLKAVKTCRGCGERDTIYISCDSPRSMFKSIPIKKRGEKKVSEMPCGLRDVAVCRRCAKTLDEKWFGGDGCKDIVLQLADRRASMQRGGLPGTKGGGCWLRGHAGGHVG